MATSLLCKAAAESGVAVCRSDHRMFAAVSKAGRIRKSKDACCCKQRRELLASMYHAMSASSTSMIVVCNCCVSHPGV
jgi:hypothetical protein